MYRLLILLCALAIVSSCTSRRVANNKSEGVISHDQANREQPKRLLPPPTGFVNDYQNVFTPEAKQELESVLTELKNKADIEFVVVTIETTGAQSIFDYSLALIREWGVGSKANSNGGGLLLLLALKDRNWRIQVSRSLEKDLPNEVVLIEVPYLRRHRTASARDLDHHSAGLWDFANAIEPIGMILGFTSIGRIHAGSEILGPIGIGLLIAGVALRWTSIYTLGRFFTPKVLIQHDHKLIRSGPYRFLRHPAYTGALIAHLGLGLSFSNRFSLALSTVPYLVATVYRVRVEELALKEALGDEYVQYAHNTKRLIPKLY